MNAGVVYFDDKPTVVREILELHITEDEKEPTPYFHPDSNECSFGMTLPYTNARKMYLSLIYGRPITNNWLKMHGGIMGRTKRRKRS